MKKLVVAQAGRWQRSNGETVAIGDMIDPHLINARAIVVVKLLEARRTRDRMISLQTHWGTTEEPMARAALGEAAALVALLEKKLAELDDEHARRFGRTAP